MRIDGISNVQKNEKEVEWIDAGKIQRCVEVFNKIF